tara:strand:+ start:5966 stop:6475 length:510 start_codon:yes stop_codon:yes gene_type:complete
MATRTATISGEVQWAKLHESNRDMKGFNDAYVKCDGAYTMDLLVDSSDFAEFKMNTKTMIKGSATSDGRVKVKLKRPHKGPFEAASGPPKVSGVDEGVIIGNGSKATVRVSSYDIKAYAGAVGTRLDEVVITDLVAFEMPEMDESIEEEVLDSVMERLKGVSVDMEIVS